MRINRFTPLDNVLNEKEEENVHFNQNPTIYIRNGTYRGAMVIEKNPIWEKKARNEEISNGNTIAHCRAIQCSPAVPLSHHLIEWNQLNLSNQWSNLDEWTISCKRIMRKKTDRQLPRLMQERIIGCPIQEEKSKRAFPLREWWRGEKWPIGRSSAPGHCKEVDERTIIIIKWVRNKTGRIENKVRKSNEIQSLRKRERDTRTKTNTPQITWWSSFCSAPITRKNVGLQCTATQHAHTAQNE